MQLWHTEYDEQLITKKRVRGDMKRWCAELDQLNTAKNCLKKKLVRLKQCIEDHFILQNLDEGHIVAKFPLRIIEIVESYNGNKQCHVCHNVYPTEVLQCVFCNPRVHCTIELHKSIQTENNRFQFQDERDSEVWQYCMQFASERNISYDYFCSGKPEDAEIIRFCGDIFWERRRKYVYMTLQMCRKGPMATAKFHELVSKNIVQHFRLQKFEFPWPFDESTKYNTSI